MSKEQMLSLDDNIPTLEEPAQEPKKLLFAVAALLVAGVLVEFGLGAWVFMQSSRISELTPKVAKAAKLQKDQTAQVAELQEAVEALTARLSALEKGQSSFGLEAEAAAAAADASKQDTAQGAAVKAKKEDSARVAIGGESMSLKDMVSTIEAMNQADAHPKKR